MPEKAKSAKLAELESFKGYGLAQFALSGEAKVRALVALAMDVVATVQRWDGTEKPKSRAECKAALSMALTLAKVPETSARRVIGTVEGLVNHFGKDYRETLASVRAEMVAEGSIIGATERRCARLSCMTCRTVPLCAGPSRRARDAISPEAGGQARLKPAGRASGGPRQMWSRYELKMNARFAAG